MRSRLITGLRLLITVTCIYIYAPMVRGDVLVKDDNVIFGKILSINNDSVVIARRCNNNLTVSVELSRIRTILLDSRCAPHTYVLPTPSTASCETEKMPAFKIQFRDPDVTVYATRMLTKDDNTINMLLAGDAYSLHGPLDRISSIVNGRFCPALFTAPVISPNGFCLEPPHIAVNWKLEPVYNNAIFTKGFAFYLEHVGPQSSVMTAEDIRLAFGAALTLWSSPLLARRESLDLPLRDFVDNNVRRSKSAVLFVPPQVVNVNCPSNASMIVKLYTVRGDAFPDERYVAKAQMRGRTVLLNGIDHQFVSRLSMRQFSEDGRINLITVFAHELGHAFGLRHTNTGPSIMSIRNPTLAPTDSDVQRFIAALRQSVVGTRPGYFDPVDCAGLQLNPKKNNVYLRPRRRLRRH